MADVFYSVEELAQIAHLASRPVRQVRPMALFVIGTQQAPTPAPALTSNQVRLRDRIVMCFNCNSPGHFARDCRLFYDLRQMGIRVPHKQCAKCKRFGHLKVECTPEVQMRASKCYNCGRFGHFSSRCTYQQVLDRPWSRPDRTLRPPPEPPFTPNTPAPPPPP